MIETRIAPKRLSLQKRYLGRLTYEEGLRAQGQAAEHVRAEGLSGLILGLEHEAVITLGKRGRAEDDLNVSAEEIAKAGVGLHVSERGGQATLHAPGQLVVYPVVDLSRLEIGVRDYVALLERSTQEFLLSLGVSSEPNPEEPGLYTKAGKIAFFGIRVSRGIASHGLAINVCNDLDLFKLIRSCGKANERFDRLANYLPLVFTDTDPVLLPSLLEAWSLTFEQNLQQR